MVSVESTKGYRWLEAELVKGSDLEKYIDTSYFMAAAETAKKDVSMYGDFDWFTSDEPYKGVVPLPLSATKAIREQEMDILRDAA